MGLIMPRFKGKKQNAWALSFLLVTSLVLGRDPLSLERETRFYLANPGLIFRDLKIDEAALKEAKDQGIRLLYWRG